ncbi:MAG: NUDIX hydrolase [Xanthobacteraceae bacterium]|nr:NUDIX hydrolase [Xanthobacteraceae bacterium]QYK43796.1 MAG: NUDIX hydrolase [Xanthobacteraceae bacterium]
MSAPDRGERWNPPEPVPLGPKSGISVQPKDSATLIIIDRSGKTPRVLLGKRNEKQAFMPGKYVFPGGRLDAADRQMKPFDELGEICARRLGMNVVKWTPSRGRALALAAIRETAEETGLLFGKPDPNGVTSKGDAWSPFVSKQIRPSLSALTFVARAITPPKRPRRFDSRFFLADRTSVGGEISGIVGPDTELVSLDWLTFEDALDTELPNITKVVIREVADRVKSGELLRPASFFCFRNGNFWRKELD